ncbi:protein TEX261-like [Ruditapes philippinarum]|uniref:protein TEX261-like n=1 Tax=Ruditapes philippinarum TaxID=129788 RepID=UPI00295B0488|nr:protein TEX261-like [Ruditapes philippinarum]
MWFLYLLSWLALCIQILVVTLSIAAGLYYLAELVEEYTVFTSKVIRYLIIFNTSVYICLLLFEEMPFFTILFGLLGNGAYFLLLREFPYFALSSPGFIGSVVSVVLNHYLAFSHFTQEWYPFHEVLAYFTVCLWMVPFAFFVSLSANENVLPTMAERPPMMGAETDVVSNYFSRKGKKYGLLSMLKTAQESMLPQRVKKHF